MSKRVQASWMVWALVVVGALAMIYGVVTDHQVDRVSAIATWAFACALHAHERLDRR